MIPTDFRDANFADLRTRVLTGQRMQVYRAWIDHGPGTTREIAERSGIDILNVRPRTTELLQVGALEVVPPDQVPIADRPGTEGVYRVRNVQEWETWVAGEREAAVSGQQQLL